MNDISIETSKAFERDIIIALKIGKSLYLIFLHKYPRPHPIKEASVPISASIVPRGLNNRFDIRQPRVIATIYKGFSIVKRHSISLILNCIGPKLINEKSTHNTIYIEVITTSFISFLFII